MHPYLFTIGGFELRIYSLMLMLALLIALHFVGRRAASLGINAKSVENCIIASFIGGVLGARAYYVLFNLPYFMEYPTEILAIWHGGLAIHGGIAASVLTMVVYCRVKGLSAFVLGDIAAPFLLLGQGIGRIGNFANGEAHGVPTITPPEIIFQLRPAFSEFWSSAMVQSGIRNTPEALTSLYERIVVAPIGVVYHGVDYLLKEYVPWGVRFPSTYGAQAYLEFGSLPVHPTFFYEMILNFIGAAIMLTLWRKDRFIGSGRIIALYLLFYAVIRGFVTFFRADDLMFLGLRAPHVASLVLLVAAAVLYKRSRHSA
ncbi:MAG: prolipoprotein diacylglyceryl transferase [Deferribacteraceae bacterium]|jgi:phosphatidylglycerol:prolipoprotein diacylglycerol transferase|nr:prolipoprotein diacylglyceryl transferase [Deferribacteraceae bacterium]